MITHRSSRRALDFYSNILAIEKRSYNGVFPYDILLEYLIYNLLLLPFWFYSLCSESDKSRLQYFTIM